MYSTTKIIIFEIIVKSAGTNKKESGWKAGFF